MKRILHIFPSLEIGGMQRRFATLVSKSPDDLQHDVIALDENYEALDLIPGLEPLDDNLPVFGDPLGRIFTARRIIKDQNPDLMVTYNWGSAEFDLGNIIFPRCVSVHVQDGFGADETDTELLRRRLLRRFAYQRCSKVIVPSHTLETIATKNWKIKPSKLDYIPNGVDAQRFSPGSGTKIRKKYKISEDALVFGTVAALRPEKDIGRMIEAFASLSSVIENTYLLIVGDGVGRAPLQMLAERTGLGDKVIFAGNQSSPNLFLRAFDVFMLSSETEQFPISVLEAMATGLPVIATDVGDLKDIVSKDNQCCIEGRDAQTSAVHMRTLALDKALRGRLGAENRKKALENYTDTKMVDAYNKAFYAAMQT